MTTENKTIPELSVDAQVLIKRLKTCTKGEFVSYETLNALIGGDVQNKNRGCLERAKIRLLRDEQMVFETVHSKGVKRTEDCDAIGIGQVATRRVRRLTRKAAEKMACHDFDKLNPEQKIEFNAYASVLGALSLVTRDAKLKAIKEAALEAKDKLPLNKTLELFKT